MKFLTLACLLVVVAAAAARPQGTYTDKFDNINLDEILGNPRLLVPYLKCVLEEGKCTADGKELKSHIREALEENCEKCTEQQKRGSRRVIGHLINHEQDYWTKLTVKYDPDHKYTHKYEQELREVKA